MSMLFKGICLLLLVNSQHGFAQEQVDGLQPASEAAAEPTGPVPESDEMGPSLGSDDLLAMGSEAEGPVLVAEFRRSESANGVMDQMELGRTEITGNQELPTVMYIVPWQPPGAMEFRYSPVSRLAEDLFRQIDRDEFRRELDYRALLAEPGADMALGE